MAAYQVIRVTEEPRLVDGKSASVIRVEWKTEQDGPFFDYFDKLTYTDQAARAMIMEKCDGLARLRLGY